METTYITALAGLVGAAIGGLTSFGTTWVTQKLQLHAQSLESARNTREKLFVDFIGEAAKLFADALSHERDEMANLVNLYAIVGHLRMVSRPETIAAAERAIDVIIDAYHAPNRTLIELREFASQGGLDPLRDLGRECRAELQALRTSGHTY